MLVGLTWEENNINSTFARSLTSDDFSRLEKFIRMYIAILCKNGEYSKGG